MPNSFIGGWVGGWVATGPSSCFRHSLSRQKAGQSSHRHFVDVACTSHLMVVFTSQMSRNITPVPRSHVAARWAHDFAPRCVLSRVSSAAAAVLTSPGAVRGRPDGIDLFAAAGGSLAQCLLGNVKWVHTEEEGQAVAAAHPRPGAQGSEMKACFCRGRSRLIVCTRRLLGHNRPVCKYSY